MIEVNGVTFAYSKSASAVEDLSFSIGSGEIFGFLGPSGAGKTTTQKILMRLLKGYQGRIEVKGRALEAWGHDYFEHIGVCFEFPSNYRKLTALENLSFFASFFNRATEDPAGLLERVGLAPVARKKVETFSKGMQIRLNLARAMINRPDILFLDEPTAGLDPGTARHIRQIIREQKTRGATVFLTTHDMALANELCDRVGFLVDGRLVGVGAPEALRLEHARRTVRVQYVVNGARDTAEFPLDGLAGNAQFRDILSRGGVETIHSQEPSLEDVFLTVTGRALS